MVRKLLTVEALFTFPSLRGAIILHPDVKLLQDFPIKLGDRIMLRKPDGTTEFHKIYSMQTACNTNEGWCKYFIILNNIHEEDIPIGTEVWTAD